MKLCGIVELALVLSKSVFDLTLQSSYLGLPLPKALRRVQEVAPFVFLGDGAFS